jgi:translation initiation factor eIF-2B subunit delta
VEGTLAQLACERGPADLLRVIVSESRPGGEGVALAAALATAGAQVTLAVDGACAALMDDVAFVLVGADSVRSDGSVVNKIGTHTLALVARAAATPVYALAESLKITAASYPLSVEVMAPDELLAEPIVGVTPRNLYFDVTPAHLISGIITELGPLTASERARLVDQAERAYQSLMRP